MLYTLSVYWTMSARVSVEAGSIEEAIAKANAAGKLPEGEYVADSFTVDEEIAREEYGDNGEKSPATQNECAKKTLTLQLLGPDQFQRPVYRGDDGHLYADMKPYKIYEPEICHKNHDLLNGIPGLPIANDIEVIFTPFRSTWD